MPEMKTLNGYEVVDAKAREDIEALKNAEVDLTGYATEAYVDKAIDEIPEPDLTKYASKEYVEDTINLSTQAVRSDMPTKTSQLTNDSRFITLADVPKTDLSNYALKASVPTKVSQLQNDSKFITREEVPVVDLSGYAKKDEIPDVSDFLTSIPSEYITESELDAKGYLTKHQSLEGLATEKYVDDAIAAIEIPEGADLREYAKKSDIPDISGLAQKSDIPDVSSFISEIPSEYITENELNAKGYLTQHQSLNGYATEAFVTNKIAEAKLEGDGESIDLSGYATKDDIRNFITEVPAEYVTESELNAKGYLTAHQDISHLAPKTSIPTKVSQLTNDSNYLTAIPGEYITEAELSAKNYLTEHQSLAAYATKTFVENTVAENQPNLTAYAKKSDIPDVSEFITSIPSEYITESELNAKGYLTQHQSLAGLATTQEVLKNATDIAEVEARVTDLETDSSKYLTAIPTEYITETELNNKGYATKSEIPDVSAYQTKAQVQALIDAALGVIENGSY